MREPGDAIKCKKKCCKSRPRCKTCPVVWKQLAKQGYAERDGQAALRRDRRRPKRALKAARALSGRRRAPARGPTARLPASWPPASSRVARGSSARTCATSCCGAATASSASTTSRRDPSPTSSTSARPSSASCTRTSSSRTSSTSRSTSSTTSPRPASPIDYLRLPLHTLKVGSHGTHHTLGLAKAHRARFLLASTSEVYGDPKVHPQPESYWGHVNPIGPRGVYDEAKRYAEALTMAYHRQQGVDTAIVRIFNTYGAADAPARRPRDPDVPAPGAAGPADHGVRRRQPDALVLLRRRPDRRASSRSPSPATTTRSTSATRTSSRCSSSPRR